MINIQEEIANHPVNLVEDSDLINNIKSLLGDGKTLIVTSEGFMRRGTISILENQFETDEIFIIHNISPNPSIEEIDEITKIYKKKGIKNIIISSNKSSSIAFFSFKRLYIAIKLKLHANPCGIL